VVYRATPDGERVAIGSLPPQPKLTRYEKFLNEDIDCTFAEWLVGEGSAIQIQHQPRHRRVVFNAKAGKGELRGSA